MNNKNLFSRIIIGIIIAIPVFSFAQNFVWAKSIGGISSDFGYAIATDASGNVYTTGYFQGTTDLDPGAGVFTVTSMGLQDIFISKLDAAGNFVWAKAMGGTSGDGGQAITIDALGNIYTTGYFDNTVDFDPGPGIFTLTTMGTEDIFISKLDAAGNFIWAKSIGGISGDGGYGIVTDAAGDVYTTGYFGDVVDFDPGVGIFNLTSVGGEDIFVSKLDASGNFVYAKAMGGTISDYGLSIATNTSGNIFITGYFGGTADFDPGPGVYNLTSAGFNDIFVSKLDATGNFVYAKAMGGTNVDYGYGITVDASDKVYTTGVFYGTSDFDPGVGIFNLTSIGSSDIFISKLDVSGNFVYAKAIGGSGSDNSNSIINDASGSVYFTGSFNGTVDFDPGVGTYTITSVGNDIFICKLNSAGNFAWAKSIGGTGSNSGNGVTLDPSGNVYTTGFYDGISDFDTGAGIYNLTSAGGPDIFVHKICQMPIASSEISGAAAICNGMTNTYSITPLMWAITYAWNLPVGWTGNSPTNTINATPGSSGIFTLSVSNVCGILTKTLSVAVNPLPTISATTSSPVLCGPPFQGTATLTGSGGLTYTWNPGGTGTSIAVSPSVTSTYTVTGTDLNGCMNSFVFTQSVSICTYINKMENSVSELNIYPNPASDILTIKPNFSGHKDLQFKIFNSLGQMVVNGTFEKESNINISGLSGGLYSIIVYKDNLKVQSQNFIKVN